MLGFRRKLSNVWRIDSKVIANMRVISCWEYRKPTEKYTNLFSCLFLLHETFHKLIGARRYPSALWMPFSTLSGKYCCDKTIFAAKYYKVYRLWCLFSSVLRNFSLLYTAAFHFYLKGNTCMQLGQIVVTLPMLQNFSVGCNYRTGPDFCAWDSGIACPVCPWVHCVSLMTMQMNYGANLVIKGDIGTVLQCLFQQRGRSRYERYVSNSPRFICLQYLHVFNCLANESQHKCIVCTGALCATPEKTPHRNRSVHIACEQGWGVLESSFQIYHEWESPVIVTIMSFSLFNFLSITLILSLIKKCRLLEKQGKLLC